MTIVLVILKALTLILAIILVFLVNKAIKRILSTITDYYSCLVDRFITLENNITTQVNTLTATINSQQQEVVRLANKVDEGLTHCGNQTKDLKDTIVNLDSHLDARLTSPIDKINDTHNRIKTLGKSATSTEELRTVVSSVVSTAVTEAVDVICQKCAPKPKTTKKVTKEPIKEGKL